MKQSAFWTKTTIGLMTFLLLQACYVQKNSETHATVIFDHSAEEEFIPEYSNDMITVAENHDHAASMEALTASITLIDIQKRRINPRWEDDISFGYSSTRNKNLDTEQREEIEPVIINSY